MKKTKFFAVVMAAVMTLSMAACGEPAGNETPTTAPTTDSTVTEAPVADPTATPVPAPQNVTIADASITFEDGNYAFVDAWMDHARSAKCDISLVDYNGSKAVKVVNTTGTSKVPFLAIDVATLFGADVANIAGVEMVIGTSYDDGSFHATSGDIMSLWGAEREDNSLGTWSVYMEKKNPKVISGKVPAGNELIADNNNIIIVGLTTDNGVAEAGVGATFYVDDIRFYDAAGNTMKPADTTVAFNWPASNGPDLSNLYAVSEVTEFPGFTTSGGGWGQNGFDIPEEVLAAMLPGTVVEIAFKSADNTMWVVMPDAAAGWSRIAQGQAYINNSGTVAQIPYEKFVEALGENKDTWGARMQCEAQTDWEVYSVKVGKATERVGIVDPVAFDGFVCSGGGWGQNGADMSQELIDALVPGSVIKISYKSADNTMWIVMPDAAAGWSRCAQGTAVCDGSTAYVTYEQIEAVCGPDKTTWGARMQFEAQTDWEVYGIEVGTLVKYPAISGLTAYDGFACSGGGWGQNGAEMPQELIDALVPGAVIEIAFASADNTMWIVMPDAAAGWSRCAQGTATIADGRAYITYEQIAAVCGPDKSTWGARMQFEAQTDWEVYGIRVGKAASTSAVEEAPAEPPVAAPVITVGEGGGTVVAADGTWWTQIPLTMEELLAGVPLERVGSITFTGNTDFIIAYNDTTGAWIQKDAAKSFSLKTEDINLTEDGYYFCFVLSKGDRVEYTLNWKVNVYIPTEFNVTVGEGAGTITHSGNGLISLTKEQLLAGVPEEEVAGIKCTTDTVIDLFIKIPESKRGFDESPVPNYIVESSFDISVENIDLEDFVFEVAHSNATDETKHTFTWQIIRKGE